jgi:hypothetical protein
MTFYALTVYRRETRYALEKALGRKVTNSEQSAFINRLRIMELDRWIATEAEIEAAAIRQK